MYKRQTLDIQVKNLDIIPVQWQTVGNPDTLITSGIEPLGAHAYLRRESFFSNIFTVSITGNACLAQDGHEII